MLRINYDSALLNWNARRIFSTYLVIRNKEWKFIKEMLKYQILGCRDPRYKHENQRNSTWILKCHEKSGNVKKSLEKSWKVMKSHWKVIKKSWKVIIRAKVPWKVLKSQEES